MANEAAERHAVYPGGPDCQPNCPGPWSAYHDGYADGYENGENAERRATVERIRTHLLSELPAPMAPGDEILWSTVVAILDKEAK